MSKKNYNKISTEKAAKVEPVAEPVEETVEVAEVVEQKVKTGVVVGCTKLNIRKAPTTTAQIGCTVDAGTTVIILDEIGEFYKIGNPDNPDFCMKKYISINS